MKLKRIAAAALMILLVVLPGCSKETPPKGTVPTSVMFTGLTEHRYTKKIRKAMTKHLDEGKAEPAAAEVHVYSDLAEKHIRFNTDDPYHPFAELELAGYTMKTENPPVVYYRGHTLRAYVYTRVIAGLTTDETVRIYTDGNDTVLRYETVNYQRYSKLFEATGDSDENVRLRRESMIQTIQAQDERMERYNLTVEALKPTSYAEPDDAFYMDTKGRAVIRMQATLRLADENVFPTSYSLTFYGVYDSKK